MERHRVVAVQGYAVGQAWGADREWQSAPPGYDWRECDISQNAIDDLAIASFERRCVNRIGDKSMWDVEHRHGAEQVQPARPEPVLEAGEVDHIIDRLAPRVGCLELQTALKPRDTRSYDAVEAGTATVI